MKSGTLFSSGLVCALSYLIPGTRAQFPPPREGITVVQSKFHENLSLSFKEVCCTLNIGTNYYPSIVIPTPKRSKSMD